MDYSYWIKQTSGKSLFPDLKWEAPERRDQRGNLAIIGGTKLGFATVASAYSEAWQGQAGQVRVIVPDALKPLLKNTMEDIHFTPSNQTGGFSKEAESDLQAAADWAGMLLLIGDTGRNSETAICFEHMLQSVDTACTITRDAVDLLSSSPRLLLEREQNVLVVSFAQLQKLLRSVLFPRGIIVSMHLAQFVEVLHKVTLSYPALVVTYHSEQLVIAKDGSVATLPFTDPMRIWRGSVATHIGIAVMQHPKKPLEAAVSAVS